MKHPSSQNMPEIVASAWNESRWVEKHRRTKEEVIDRDLDTTVTPKQRLTNIARLDSTSTND